jgi:hypothetical protein
LNFCALLIARIVDASAHTLTLRALLASCAAIVCTSRQTPRERAPSAHSTSYGPVHCIDCWITSEKRHASDRAHSVRPNCWTICPTSIRSPRSSIRRDPAPGLPVCSRCARPLCRSCLEELESTFRERAPATRIVVFLRPHVRIESRSTRSHCSNVLRSTSRFAVMCSAYRSPEYCVSEGSCNLQAQSQLDDAASSVFASDHSDYV